MNQNSKNYVSGIVKRRNLSEFDMSKLGIGFDDEKSERKTSEKALVLSQINVLKTEIWMCCCLISEKIRKLQKGAAMAIISFFTA
ncbi:hypothetical protein ES288_D05G411900v1 [Gossypium darwinii]|uniref:Uncharacterized protein n=1 Tax=Gossypium darwinii TaxID=34276 RepID=A0A5D2CU19_GOSDA|nr:hypothetical protein ES288_D05G411900v1 [Gossypium darwinii]